MSDRIKEKPLDESAMNQLRSWALDIQGRLKSNYLRPKLGDIKLSFGGKEKIDEQANGIIVPISAVKNNGEAEDLEYCGAIIIMPNRVFFEVKNSDYLFLINIIRPALQAILNSLPRNDNKFSCDFSYNINFIKDGVKYSYPTEEWNCGLDEKGLIARHAELVNKKYEPTTSVVKRLDLPEIEDLDEMGVFKYIKYQYGLREKPHSADNIWDYTNNYIDQCIRHLANLRVITIDPNYQAPLQDLEEFNMWYKAMKGKSATFNDEGFLR